MTRWGERLIWRPAEAEIVGDGRPWTVLMISLLSMPCRQMLVMPRLARASWRRITTSGTPSCEGIPLLVIQGQLGHADLAVTSAYLRGIDSTEIIDTVHDRSAPMVLATARFTHRG